MVGDRESGIKSGPCGFLWVSDDEGGVGQMKEWMVWIEWRGDGGGEGLK